MFYDARQAEQGTQLQADICVVGAGAAGIALALSLSDSGRRVLLVESGGFSSEAATQALYRGDSTGRAYAPLDAARLRYFGGTTNHWTGWTRRLDTLDFERREWLDNSGWPFGEAELAPWYDRAEHWVELGDHSYRPGYWEQLFGRRLFAGAEGVETVVARHSPPTRFGRRYRAALHASETVSVLLHANLVDFGFSPSGKRVSEALLKTLDGRSLVVRARHYVLATGGIENARLLLSMRGHHENGPGNRHGLVGRYFADHGGNLLGVIAASSPLLRQDHYSNRRYRGGGQKRDAVITPGLKLTAPVLREHRLPNFAGLLLAWFPERDEQQPFGRISAPPDHNLFDFYVSIEPEPRFDSRVTLGEEKDALGMRRPVLHWTRRPDHGAVCERLAERFALELGKAGLGRMRLDLGKRDYYSLRDGMQGYGYHHMGTTRMHDDPRRGVVDRHCRVHDVDNLHIAGSSVFPTYGYAQPTLTIIALALRLADHLHRTIDREA